MFFTNLILFFVTSVLLSSCNSIEEGSKIANGIFTGKSQSKYTYEPYIGIATIEVDDHKIVKVDFQIVDTLHNEVFNADYEKHFAGNEMYITQCRNDWKGVQNYPAELLKKQNIDSVDAVSGATWSYNIFKASVEKALDHK